MGTNYYATLPGENICSHCGRGDNGEELHIGKSSGGWCFALRVYPEREINTLDDWKKILSRPGVRIKDEYGDPRTLDYLLATITQRSWPEGKKELDFHRQNHSEDGPNNLVRSRIDGVHTVGHGEGTWDYCVGDFS